ncbi:MAG: cobalamin B12-binding domain-containing protein [Clostridiales bacterium]|nr:cobalamin B12-binding domain-containing protein [Clostridiales bacterium]
MNDNLNQYRAQLITYMEAFDRDNSVSYALSLLADGKVSIPDLYEGILTPVLNSISVSRASEDEAIWKEHVMTGIVRTIVECAYPFVLKQRKPFAEGKKQVRVIILCPEEEYHELGARMGADFYELNGFEVFFIGCNTPKENFISAYNALKPEIIAISITNYLNLISLKQIIEEIRGKIGNEVKVLLSGSAFASTRKTAKDFGATALVGSYAEIEALRGD